jgi:hypothetical protein
MEQNFNISIISRQDLVAYESTIFTVVLGVKLTEPTLNKIMGILRKVYQQRECKLEDHIGLIADVENSVARFFVLFDNEDSHQRLCAIIWFREIIFGISGTTFHSYGLALAERVPLIMVKHWNHEVLPTLGPNAEPTTLAGHERYIEFMILDCTCYSNV